MKRRLLIALAIGSAGLATAQRVGTPTDDLSNLSVDDLFRLEVTSVGRKAQELAKAPAAIYVLTAEDIRRSGAASIPEALLGVPGLTVQQVAGNMWAVSARGFARPYSDKMLVMIDGRSLYTPLFSGVLWDMTDVPLENIERIEIIRGPGAVMWGPNAVNGVINIITKSARDTQGALVSVESGNEIHGSVFARWGAAPSKRFAYQVWAKLEDENPAGSSFGWYRFDLRDPNRTPTPLADLNSQSARLGFRMEGQIAGRDELMVQGDLFKMGSRGAMGYPAPQPYSQDVRFEHTGGMGGFLQVRWTRAEAAGNESSLQFTYDKQAIDYPYLGGKMANLTVDFQKRLQTSDRNEVYWGGGFQHYSDSTYSSHFVAFDPPTGAYCLADAVLRDEFQLIPNRLLVSAGVRADYTTYGKFDLQPSVRFLYTPNARQSVWLALSRAVRVPSRLDRDLRSDLGYEMFGELPIHLQVFGSKSMQQETENSLELGYRIQSGQHWSADFAAFWSYYKNLVAATVQVEPQLVFVGGNPELQLNAVGNNGGSARLYGAEASITWQVRPTWRLVPTYSYLDESPQPPVNGLWMLDNSSYRHQGAIRSRYDITRHWQLDVMPYAMSRNAVFGLPGALLADARLGWRPSRDTELSVSIRNLTGREILETYAESGFVSLPTRRTFSIRWAQKF